MKSRSIKLGKTLIDDHSDAYVIAEIGHNHQGSLEKAQELFHAAQMAGVNAVKLQKRNNRAVFTQAAYNRPYDNKNSFGETYGKHREALEFNKSEYTTLRKLAKKLRMDFVATAFDPSSADFLGEVGVDCIKIASADLRNWPLLVHVAKMGKPMIMSCGGSTIEEIRASVEQVLPWNRKLILLDCVMTYPTNAEDMNLKVIETLREAFPEQVIGLSDHYNGISMAPVAYVLGARVFEKHFTLNRAMKGTDHAFSLEPIGMHKMVRDLQRVRQALGDGVKRQLPEESAALAKMGKSLVAARALKRGHKLRRNDITCKTPGGGMPPSEFDMLVGSVLKHGVEKDHPFCEADCKKS